MKKSAVLILIIMAALFCGCAQKKEEETAAAAVNTAEAEAEKPEQKAETKEAEAEKPEQKAETKEVEAEKPEQKTEAKKEETEKPEANKTEEVDRKASKEEAKAELAEYTVTAFEEAKTMYAANPVNLRKGPSTDFERVGGLNRGQEVSVTGQADTGWYELVYGEEKAYVSNHYLQDEKPAEEVQPEPVQAAEQAQQPAQAVTTVKNVAGVIMVGDSRFVQMQGNIGENGCTWIAENGKGYHWLNETAMSSIDGCVGKGSKVLINLGVNDPGNINNYLTLINAKAAEWVGRGAKVYYASVNPVWENPYVTEDQVHYFNSQLQSGLSGDIRYIDSHSYLDSIGYKLVDGLHYNSETYQNLYAYFMSCL